MVVCSLLFFSETARSGVRAELRITGVHKLVVMNHIRKIMRLHSRRIEYIDKYKEKGRCSVIAQCRRAESTTRTEEKWYASGKNREDYNGNACKIYGQSIYSLKKVTMCNRTFLVYDSHKISI
jgi:hypothetical protein